MLEATEIHRTTNAKLGHDLRVYRLEEPYSWEWCDEHNSTEYIAVSQINHEFAHETLAFPANQEGPVDYMEVAGLRGEVSHEEILRMMGYTPTKRLAESEQEATC